jgi:hypothetical protein
VHNPPGIQACGAGIGDAVRSISFDGYVECIYPSLSPAQQDVPRILREVAVRVVSLERWLPSPRADIRVHEYKIAKSSCWRTSHREPNGISGLKAIAGNQSCTSCSRLFPTAIDFAGVCHLFASQDRGNGLSRTSAGRCTGRERASHARLDQRKAGKFDNIHLAISTRSPPPVHCGCESATCTRTPPQSHLYPIAGSFAQFLIETHGTEMFRALFERTPLIPMERNPGSPERWADAYGRPLLELELEWKSMIVSC